MTESALPDHPVTDDLVAAFQIENQPVRGRIARLGAAVDEIIARHAYPEPVANLLGEACALAALVGDSLKFEGRLIVQAQGQGAVKYVVADYDTSGALRGYCRFDAEAVAEVSKGFARPGARSLLGGGAFVMTVDPKEGERYQGVTPIDGETLAHSAEEYFSQSEQVPTKVRLAVAQVQDAEGSRWRAGGAMIQRVAGDLARGDTEEAWDSAQALFATLADDELVDPNVPPETLLYRLFHEEGVRLFEPKKLRAACRCSHERVFGMLRTFSPEERAEMTEADGRIRVNCEYCSRNFEIEPGALETEG